MALPASRCQHALGVRLGRGQLPRALLRLRESRQRLKVVGLDLEAAHERLAGLGVELLAVEGEPERHQGEAAIGLERQRVLQRERRRSPCRRPASARHPAGSGTRTVEGSMRASGSSERIAVTGRRAGQRHAARGASTSSELGASARALRERVERPARLAALGLEARQAEQRSHRVAIARGRVEPGRLVDALRREGLVGLLQRDGRRERGRLRRLRSCRRLRRRGRRRRRGAERAARAAHEVGPRRLSLSFWNASNCCCAALGAPERLVGLAELVADVRVVRREARRGLEVLGGLGRPRPARAGSCRAGTARPRSPAAPSAPRAAAAAPRPGGPAGRGRWRACAAPRMSPGRGCELARAAPAPPRQLALLEVDEAERRVGLRHVRLERERALQRLDRADG